MSSVCAKGTVSSTPLSYRDVSARLDLNAAQQACDNERRFSKSLQGILVLGEIRTV